MDFNHVNNEGCLPWVWTNEIVLYISIEIKI